ESILRQIQGLKKQGLKQIRKKEFRKIQSELSGIPSRGGVQNPGNLRAQRAEEALIAYIINNQDMAAKALSLLPPEKMLTPFNQRVYRIITDRAQQGRGIMPTDISGEFTVEENGLIAWILAKRSSDINSITGFEDCIRVILSESERIT